MTENKPDLDALEKLADEAIITRTCDWCGKDYGFRRHEDGRSRFCSKSCRMAEVNKDRWGRYRERRDETLKAKFLSLPNENGCLVHRKSVGSDGYSRIKIDGKTHRAHRVSLTLFKGEPVTPDLLALHSCDNPVCCNPDHLRWGTQKDNTQDKFDRDRQPEHMRPCHGR